MKRLLKIIASSLLLLGVATAPAMAGDHDHGRDRGYQDHGRSQHDDRGNHRGRYDYRADRNHYRPVPPRVVYRPAPRPYWVRGGRYYGSGYAPTYVVNDWGRYGLRTPPRGYYWRRSDTGDYLLVALATGIIADIILNH